MRGPGPRSARAKRRSQTRPEAAPRPKGWPEGSVLAEALEVDSLVHELLAELRPEVMRTILQRMDVQVRKSLLAPHNVPVTKVSLRAASQVLALVRAEDKPAESPLLGTMLAPAAELFNDANVGPTQRTGLQLRLVDLALPLIIQSESTFQGLRTWHRWGEDDFEDLTLAVVIGQDCSHAGLAASYLAHSRPEIGQRYERLREEYPALPTVSHSRLTQSNPLRRYMAARPDRKLPGSAAEMQALLHDDTRTRRIEIEQMRKRRAEAAAARERQLRQREDALLNAAATVTTPEAKPVEPEAVPDPLATPSDAGLSALPSMAEWAAAVTDSRALTQRLINGEPPSLPQLRSIIDLSLRLTNMAELASRVLGEPVAAQRGDIDRALTVILADEELSRKLERVPESVAGVADALRRLPPLPGTAAGRPPTAPRTVETETLAEPTATTAAAETPAAQAKLPTATPPPPAEPPLDLSDLDSILHGEAGARLAALAGAREPEDHSPAPAASDPAAPAEDPDDETDDVDDDETAPPADPEADALERRLVTAALHARHPGGALAEDYAASLSQLDIAEQLDTNPRRRLTVAATALPMALLDPASGASELLDIEVPELGDWPNLVSLRRVVAEYTRNGDSLYAPDMQLHALLSFRLTKIRYRARQIRETAATRTLKYDKATKVYRAWFSAGGRLRPLLDCLEGTEFSKLQVLVDDAEKVGASRSISETLSDLFDKGKPRIVAGARQSLVDSYDEVVNLGASVLAVHKAIVDRASHQHDAHRRFQRATDFGDRVERLRDGLAAELDGPQPPPPVVRRLVNRALDFQHHLHPSTGPEPAIEWLLERRPEDPA